MSNERHTQPRSGANLADNGAGLVQPLRTSPMDTVLTIGGITTGPPARASTLPCLSSAPNNTTAAVIARSMTFTDGIRMPASDPLHSTTPASWKRPSLESVGSIFTKVWQSIISFRLSHLRHGWRPTAALLLLIRSGNYTGDVDLDRQIIVDELGTYLGRHTKGRRIQYWTMISVCFLIIKLCAVRGAPLFTFIGMTYAVSWASVEILLVLLQQEGLSEDQVDALLDSRRAAAKVAKLQSWGSTVWVSTSFCTILGIFLFAAFKTSTGFLIHTWISFFATMFAFPLAVASAIASYTNISDISWSVPSALIGIMITIAWPLYLFFAMTKTTQSGASAENIWGVFTIATLLFWVFRFLTLYCAATVLLFTCKLASSTIENDKRQSMIWQRVVNALLCLLTVGAYLYYYTADGTYKPPFLEMIGM